LADPELLDLDEDERLIGARKACPDGLRDGKAEAAGTPIQIPGTCALQASQRP
jgi:hypothetical protein